MTVAALYIDPRGPYPKLLGPELCWDESRDARLYDGPHPVVAHPPCGPWGSLKHLYLGSEHDCGPRAVEQVRKWGGALEHPARSALWGACSLPAPGAGADAWGGFSVLVEQVEWGHPARKKTWLYVVGVAPEQLELLIAHRPSPGREPTHWCSGRRTPFTGKCKGSPPGLAPAGIKFCSTQQRRRTPVAFAEFLIALAEQANQRAAEVA